MAGCHTQPVDGYSPHVLTLASAEGRRTSSRPASFRAGFGSGKEEAERRFYSRSSALSTAFLTPPLPYFFFVSSPCRRRIYIFFSCACASEGGESPEFWSFKKNFFTRKKYEKKKTSPLDRHAFHLISLVVYLFSSRHSHLTAACSGRRILPAGIVDPRDSRYVLESIHLCVCMCV